MTDDSAKCPKCGAAVPSDAPGGVCPNCLMREGVASVRESQESQVQYGGRPAPAEPEELTPLFPDLEVIEMIGRGGMGTVYRARQTRLHRDVALKILDNEATRGAAFSDRFAREARTLALVSHPNIVSIHDYGEVEGLHYLVMEFVDGANLREVLQAGEMSPEEAVAIVPQICDALQFAHEEGVVHRDIKPENILVDRRGRVKIADFGLAKMLVTDDPDRTLTMTGQMMGTPAYMAPEQIERPGQVDHRADIYSLGVVFYEMLTGELPLGRFAPPSGKVEVDVRLDEVVLRSLSKEPELRYQRAREVKIAVESIDEMPLPPQEPQPGPPDKEDKKAAGKTPRTKAAVKGAAAAAAAFAGGAAAIGAEAVSIVEDTLSGTTAPPGAQASGAPTKTIRVRRPLGVTLIAVYCVLWFGILIPSGSLVQQELSRGGRRGSTLEGLFNPMMYLGGPLFGTWTLAVLGVIVALGLFRLKKWARIGAIFLAFFGCFMIFPLGLALSVPIIAYLMRKDVVQLFELGEGPATVDAEQEARLGKYARS